MWPPVFSSPTLQVADQAEAKLTKQRLALELRGQIEFARQAAAAAEVRVVVSSSF